MKTTTDYRNDYERKSVSNYRLWKPHMREAMPAKGYAIYGAGLLEPRTRAGRGRESESWRD